MRYGYISNYWPESYDLISPRSLTRISLATSSYSTFILNGHLNKLDKWLREYSKVKIALHDPFNFSALQPSITIELRRQYSLFFAPFQLIIRPTILADLNIDSKTSDSALADHFRYPIYRKLIVKNTTTCAEIADFLNFAKLSTEILQQHTVPIPVTIYQVGKAQLTMAQFEIVSRYRRMVINHVLVRYSGPAPLYDDNLPPPNYLESQANTPPLPQYSGISSIINPDIDITLSSIYQLT